MSPDLASAGGRSGSVPDQRKFVQNGDGPWDRGGDRAAAMYSLIVTAKLNDIDPQAWLTDVLRRINDHQASRLDEWLP